MIYLVIANGETHKTLDDQRTAVRAAVRLCLCYSDVKVLGDDQLLLHKQGNAVIVGSHLIKECYNSENSTDS
jgi:hypothetical protein